MRTKWIIPGAIIAALFQTAVLGWIIEGRAEILRNGVELTLKTVPIDPRDLWRGKYVRLNYQISRVDGGLFHKPTEMWKVGSNPVFVVAQMNAGNLDVIQVLAKRPDNLQKGQFLLKAWFRSRRTEFLQFVKGRPISLKYNIERYYVPEYDAKGIEASYRDDKVPVDVVVSLHPSGTMHIKRLLIAGKIVHEEAYY